MELAFYLSGLVAVLATLGVITGTNPVHAVVYLIVSLIAVALVFFALGAPFAGALEIIVYAGAIMVLFVFVVMMLNLRPDEAREQTLTHPRYWAGPSVLALVLLVALVALIGQGGVGEIIDGELLTARAVALTLFGPWLLVVELAAILLLAALVTASRGPAQEIIGQSWRCFMTGIPMEHGLILAAILFSLGLLGLMLRRNMLFVLMSLEVMLNSAALAFVVGATAWNQPDGQAMFLLVITLAAAEASVGLALMIQLYQRFRTLDLNAVSRMRG